MRDEELAKIIKKKSSVHVLDANKAYIIQVDVGEMSPEFIHRYLKNLGEQLKNLGLFRVILNPTHGTEGEMKFYEIKNSELSVIE